MLGQPLKINGEKGLMIHIAPFTRDDMPTYINGGIQNRSVTRYTNMDIAPTIEQEHDWFDKVRTDPKAITWGVWVEEDGERKLIGTTSLNSIKSEPLKTATSGIVIFDKRYWGKGIASKAHKARTWFAFHEANISTIRSVALLDNQASAKALLGCGYRPTHIERNYKFTDGRYHHAQHLECLNPLERAWSNWWQDDAPDKLALEARDRTLEALQWAEDNIVML